VEFRSKEIPRDIKPQILNKTKAAKVLREQISLDEINTALTPTDLLKMLRKKLFKNKD